MKVVVQFMAACSAKAEVWVCFAPARKLPVAQATIASFTVAAFRSSMSLEVSTIRTKLATRAAREGFCFASRPRRQYGTYLYATKSRLQLNNNPEAIGTLPATGIIEAIPLSPAEQLRFEAGVPPSELNIGAATFVPGANDPDNLREARFLQRRGQLHATSDRSFGYTISYQGLVTNRSSINGPLGVGFQPFGGTTRSDFDARIHTLNARVDVQAGRYNYITGGYEFESENFKNPSFQVNPADNSDVDVTQTKSRHFCAGPIATS